MIETCKLCGNGEPPIRERPTYERHGQMCTRCFKRLWKEDYNFNPHQKCEPWICVYCRVPVEPGDKDSLGIQMCKDCRSRLSEEVIPE